MQSSTEWPAATQLQTWIQHAMLVVELTTTQKKHNQASVYSMICSADSRDGKKKGSQRDDTSNAEKKGNRLGTAASCPVLPWNQHAVFECKEDRLKPRDQKIKVKKNRVKGEESEERGEEGAGTGGGSRAKRADLPQWSFWWWCAAWHPFCQCAATLLQNWGEGRQTASRESTHIDQGTIKSTILHFQYSSLGLWSQVQSSFAIWRANIACVLHNCQTWTTHRHMELVLHVAQHDQLK